jgi:hypothetical protein
LATSPVAKFTGNSGSQQSNLRCNVMLIHRGKFKTDDASNDERNAD